MKEKLKSIFIIFISFIIIFSNMSFAAEDINFKSMIRKEEGSLFEKIIAETIGGIAQTIYSFATSDTLGVGFKNYDKLIFNSNMENDSISPFTRDTWNKILDWYKIFSIISGSLIFIGVVILSYKLIYAGINTTMKNEVKENLMRLLFGGCAIALCPLFIRFLLFLNNSLVHILVSITNGGLDGLLGNEMLSSISTGNAITTAIVISMFIYLFIKLNIKFIVREFNLIVFTIFTPIVAGLWIINKNVTAAAIWSGQILINVFMQFIYCFLFLLYLSFLPSTAGWAVSLIWAMMILPLADTLQNCLQNLTSRIAGIDNNDMTARALGMGSSFAYSLLAIKSQFPNSANQNVVGNAPTNNMSNSSDGIMGKMKNLVTPPPMNLSNENDYNGNYNPIRNVVSKETSKPITPINNISNNLKTDSNVNNNSGMSNISKVAKAGIGVAGAYLSMGAKMAEGNFNTNYNQNNNYKRNSNKMQRTVEYQNSMNMQKGKSDKENE